MSTRPDGIEHADLVVVGAGTVGGWASWFAATAGAGRVVVLERDVAGQGASSRAAGIVRAQGGTPTTVALGRWSIDFYRRQAVEIGTDSGFRQLGYLILAVTAEDERAGRERVAMQQAEGLAVRWLDATAAAALAGTLAPVGHRGGSYLETDGYIDPPRNVRAYSLAMQRAGVDLRERTAFTGLRTEPTAAGGRRVAGVETPAGPIATERVILTGGPSLRAVGRVAGVRIPSGAVRHTVAILEPHEAFAVAQPMVFDIGAGLYWRLEEGGLLFGWSDPNDRPGEARDIDWAMYEAMRARLAGFVPVTEGLRLRKIWAATIDFTPDHLPILGPGLAADGRPIDGLTVASAGGHGMMWGPGVARAAADLAMTGRTDVVDATDLGLDRFDERGQSRLASDPIALPFPLDAEDGDGAGDGARDGPAAAAKAPARR
ncbi:MAG TPA: FAD-binding oxidoreductase [Candidatus Limnocylindrales bacterium]|nr:FAD-binding oxidoreductase [Candidatus Limnocylindrales bacterium]